MPSYIDNIPPLVATHTELALQRLSENHNPKAESVTMDFKLTPKLKQLQYPELYTGFPGIRHLFASLVRFHWIKMSQSEIIHPVCASGFFTGCLVQYQTWPSFCYYE
ncbi:hypothetical protein M8J75_006657 [Diaphorina citri]|nr:hypothetical protein M8J75_006657 [Diaphorina citri]